MASLFEEVRDVVGKLDADTNDLTVRLMAANALCTQLLGDNAALQDNLKALKIENQTLKAEVIRLGGNPTSLGE